MQNALSISPSSNIKPTPLSQYDYGVIYTIKTVGQDYETDKATAEKLSHVLLNGSDLKFVKVQTYQGIVVLNVSTIMGISTDDTGVIRILNRLSNQVESINSERKYSSLEPLTKDKILDSTNDDKVGYFQHLINSTFRYEGRAQSVTFEEAKDFIERAKTHTYVRLTETRRWE